ncbi:hypothetical protein [Halomonas sp. BL6]|uniref:hypothetical protein n=1 Tax=Halomonas sp. BL6 TaxID=2585770 RepID=UPI0011195A13|nr:hypothetical protein [Halomonas sp. BL6]TNH19992.1 hypothetical protein FHJ80_02090 [Halomonas sp. BL6]
MINILDRVKGGDITRFLEAKGVGDNCPICLTGILSISVFDPEGVMDDQAPAVRVVHTINDGSHRGYGEFLRVCSHCAFIHYIRDIEVLDFIEQEGENGE